LKHPASRELHAYWDRLRGARSAPDQSRVDPAALSGVLGSLFVLDAVAERGMPFQLAGTRICDLFGRELRERPLLDLFAAADRASIRDTVAAVVDDAAVAIAGVAATTENVEGRIEAELLLLPLRREGLAHGRLIGSLGILEGGALAEVTFVRELSLRSLRILWPSGRRSDFERGPETAAAPAAPAPARRPAWLRVLEGGLGRTLARAQKLRSR
jgi:hypothetical protein